MNVPIVKAMKRILEISNFFFILLSISQGSSAQERVMRGRVFTFDSIPLVNANVEVISNG
jgi:hypothetical protein